MVDDHSVLLFSAVFGFVNSGASWPDEELYGHVLSPSSTRSLKTTAQRAACNCILLRHDVGSVEALTTPCLWCTPSLIDHYSRPYDTTHTIPHISPPRLLSYRMRARFFVFRCLCRTGSSR